ncbi:PREDICTED: UPF0481 protein At3g47200-like [Nelumbo nucifera]|uniref:UPF0481 protein At3g47200-like n=2 Tax=Nelumbo nucifera TaxID=4432 RepID=A0A1U8B218_NELNU|nr:PREDICTED: UPF0481 protein At3g47200-like [Nelumbo nucifera]DAD42672.1 TPA_asm: hypothetical protein HUJ06_000902 [Nelumbo nucifera]
MVANKIASTDMASNVPNTMKKEQQTISSSLGRDMGTAAQWLLSVEQWKSRAGINQPQKHQIQKVPSMMRKGHEKIYDPQVVSIGPCHHGEENLKEIENHKPKIANKLASLANLEVQDLYHKAIENNESTIEEARKSYTDEIINKFNEMVPDKRNQNEFFKRLMFLDGCFIVYFICCVEKQRLEDMEMKNDDIFLTGTDLFKVENQIPFIVIEELMKAAFQSGIDYMEMINRFVEATNILIAKDGMGGKPQRKVSSERPSHLLDLLRSKLTEKSDESKEKQWSCFPYDRLLRPCFSVNNKCLPMFRNDKAHGSHRQGTDCCSSFQKPSRLFPFKYVCKPNWRERFIWHSFRSAKELKEMGIRFRMSKSYSFKSVHFRLGYIQGYVYIPGLVIDRSTEVRFLNLVAYDRCFGKGEKEVDDANLLTSYICFLDSLIDHGDDVKELRSDGVLFNYLGTDEEAANLINELARGLVAPDRFIDVKEKIQRYCRNKMRTSTAEMLSKHFRNPWTALALFGAILVLFLTAIQTYLTFAPRKQ